MHSVYNSGIIIGIMPPTFRIIQNEYKKSRFPGEAAL